MKRVLMLLADGFEETEAISAHDIFHRSGEIETIMASIKNKKVTTSMGLQLEADATLDDIEIGDFDLLYLPGGKKGVDNLNACQDVHNIIRWFIENKKDVAAICAAPSLLIKDGYIGSLPYTCYPGFEGNNDKYEQKGYIINDHIFTGRSMGYTIEFALAVVEKYFGSDLKEKIRLSINGGLN